MLELKSTKTEVMVISPKNELPQINIESPQINIYSNKNKVRQIDQVKKLGYFNNKQ